MMTFSQIELELNCQAQSYLGGRIGKYRIKKIRNVPDIILLQFRFHWYNSVGKYKL